MASASAKLLHWFFDLIDIKYVCNDIGGITLSLPEVQKRGPARPNLYWRCQFDFQEFLVAGYPVFEAKPRLKSSTQNCKNHILFIHGGGYIWDLLSLHWRIISFLIEKTGASVTIPVYPLVPEHSWCAMHHMIKMTYLWMLNRYPHEKISIVGDSAGGGLSLALTQSFKKEGIVMPDKLVLFSPWLDISLSDPRQNEIESRDPLLNREGMLAIGKVYADGLPLNDPRISPLFGNMKNLPPIAVFSGTRDILNVDAHRLKTRIEKVGGKISFFEYPDMMHDWMGMPIPEAKKALEQAAIFLKKDINPDSLDVVSDAFYRREIF
ncbi:MAG: alpha/beta hydrolase [Zymomonas mobilis subsp. pomaceae]|uniref:alpha/beta hydrolase fold domain-containing protein n=1 Tax=Zymomonas mobilis TaxID=542 RepID=UPI0039EA751D